MKLFPRDKTVGTFRGFSEGGLEFHADLVLPYRHEFQSTPMHGQFLVVQLENENEAVLGRITSMSSQGRLASASGEDYANRAVAEDRPIPEDLREQYLKYKVNIRVLGVLRLVGDKLQYAASHRRLPHVGSKVAFLADDVLQEVAGHNIPGAEIGYFALGEFIYAGTDKGLKKEEWMQVKMPAIHLEVRRDPPRLAPQLRVRPRWLRQVEPRQAPFQQPVQDHPERREAEGQEGTRGDDHLRPGR